MNPERTFRSSMRLGPYGERLDIDGRGYYSMSHEMLHYALGLRGFAPTKLHHCLMLYPADDLDAPGIMDEVASHLVEARLIAPSARLRGLRAGRELGPCADLTLQEIHQVEEFRARLDAIERYQRRSPGGS